MVPQLPIIRIRSLQLCAMLPGHVALQAFVHSTLLTLLPEDGVQGVLPPSSPSSPSPQGEPVPPSQGQTLSEHPTQPLQPWPHPSRP